MTTLAPTTNSYATLVSDAPVLPGAGGSRRVDELLARMRDGDRDAAAEFITRYGSRVRRRIRGKLGASMRRLFDSQEILSTVSRQLDLYVRDKRLQAVEEDQLWSFIFTMANNAMLHKGRVFRRLQAVEGSDSRFAQELLARLEQAEQSNGAQAAELELDRALTTLTDATDREILSLWLQGESHANIAQTIGFDAATVRKRWQRLKTQLRDVIESGTT